MKERSTHESSVSEHEREYSDLKKKTQQEIFREFDPRLTELYGRIIAHLSEHGVNNIKELRHFDKEEKELSKHFFDKVKEAGKSFDLKFERYGFRRFEISWLDLIWYRNDQREKRHQQDSEVVKEVIEQKPSILEFQFMIESAKAEVAPWKQLEDQVESKFGENFVGSATWDAIEDKISDTKGKSGFYLLERALEETKDEKQEYTEEDYKRAKQDLESANEIGMSGSNPKAGRARQQDARSRLRTVEQALKKSGQFEKTLEEKLTEELDKLYPDAKSKTNVEYQGKKYQIRYFPLESSRTGKTVFEWGHQWIPFLGEQVKKSPNKRSKKK